MNEKHVEILQTENDPKHAESGRLAFTKDKLTRAVGVRYMGIHAPV